MWCYFLKQLILFAVTPVLIQAGTHNTLKEQE